MAKPWNPIYPNDCIGKTVEAVKYDSKSGLVIAFTDQSQLHLVGGSEDSDQEDDFVIDTTAKPKAGTLLSLGLITNDEYQQKIRELIDTKASAEIAKRDELIRKYPLSSIPFAGVQEQDTAR